MAALAPLPSLAAGASFFSGREKLRVSFPIQSLVPSSRGLQVGAALSHGEQSYSQRAVIATNAVATTDFVRTLGYTLEDEDDEEFDDEEIIHVDNESIDDADQLDISRLGIPDSVVDALEKRGITQLFPIQRAVLDPAMQGRDLIARAKTGTGKTLAFGIPIINNIMRENESNRLARMSGRAPRALVLAPTRELAKQVEREFMESAPMLSTICVYGGVSITTQQRMLTRGVDIAVGTPGRIIDLINRGSLHLDKVRFLVLDEADQMLAVGFEEDVEQILEQMPGQRQSMLFSATMPSWVKKLSRKYLNNPLTIDLVGENDEKLADRIALYAVSIVPQAKRSILNDLISVYAKGGKTIVFTQTKRDADEVSTAMSRILGCEALHGDITQMQREKTLNAFRDGNFSVLVATDVAARGLDIPNVDLVIHYEIPNDPETFVHRSGRTGRAGKAGTAILMYSDKQVRTMRLIEKDVGAKFTRIGAPRAEDVLRASSESATAVIKRVSSECADVFMETAEELLKEQGPTAFAAALAHLAGFTQLPASRSLITHEEGLTTLRLVRPQGPRPMSARTVMGVLSDIWQAAADNVGKIKIVDDLKTDSAVFDLPADIAKQLLEKPTPEGEVIAICKSLPKLVESEFGSERGGDVYGRFSRGRGGSYGGGSRGGRDRIRDNDRFGSRERSSRSDRGSFSGACFICNKPGHRATDCPERR